MPPQYCMTSSSATTHHNEASETSTATPIPTTTAGGKAKQQHQHIVKSAGTSFAVYQEMLGRKHLRFVSNRLG